MQKHFWINPRHASVHCLGHAYLKPLPMGLHLEDDAGVRFGKSVSVRNAFARHTQLNFGQAGAVKDSQCVGGRLINVAHLLHSVLGKKKRKKDMPITTVFVKGERLPITFQNLVQYTSSNIECIYCLTFSPSGTVPMKQANKQTKPKKWQKKEPWQVLVHLANNAIFLYDLHAYA